MTDFRAASPGAREQNWDEATKCKACDCEEDIFHIPIESKTSCVITPRSDKRMAYAHSKKTPSCSENRDFVAPLGDFFKEIDNKVALLFPCKMHLVKLINITFPLRYF